MKNLKLIINIHQRVTNARMAPYVTSEQLLRNVNTMNDRRSAFNILNKQGV